MTSHFFLVAELEQKIVGFASLNGIGYLDLLYVHKNYQRKGIAGKLYDGIEQEAKKRNVVNLMADVSKTARPFFEKKGFCVVETKANLFQGIEIVNFEMTKKLW